MKIEKFSHETQRGLLQWATDVHADDMLFDGIGSNFQEWAAIYFQLRVADDRPEWFPKGKSATLQLLEQWLLEEAKSN